jgi:hypothetical protein
MELRAPDFLSVDFGSQNQVLALLVPKFIRQVLRHIKEQ